METQANKKVEAIIAGFMRAKAQRTNWEQYWEELCKYFHPMKNDVYGFRSKGEKRGHELYDAEGVQSNESLAANLHSMFTNPTTEFLSFEPIDPMLMNIDEVLDYTGQVTNICHKILSASNFQTEIHEVYLDLGALGTAVLLVEEDDETVVRFKAINIWECYPVENAKGMIDKNYRLFKWTLSQIVDEWGIEKLSRDLQEKLKVNPQEEYEIIHYVAPRDSKDIPYDGPVGPKQFAFASYYILLSDKTVLEEGGFQEFPYIIPRWTQVAGEVYGRSCGMKALPDMKTLNKMAEVTLKAAQLNIAPPMNVPDDGYQGGLKLKPLGINYYRSGTKDRAEPMLTGVRVDIGKDMLIMYQDKVKKHFYVDKWELREGPQKTATEVQRLNEDTLKPMSPIMGRQHNEILKPLGARLVGVLKRRGMLPPLPNALKGAAVDIVYSSQVARVQKMNEANNFLRGLQAVGGLMAAKPDLLDNIDGDKAVRYVLRSYGTPEDAIAKEAKVRQSREARAQAQQEQIEAQKQMQAAETVNKMSPMMKQMQGE